jgi:hypothetical protein
LKAYFGIVSLRQLVQFLHHHHSWCQIIGLAYVPHLSTFSRTAAWWREKGMHMLHNGLLRQLSLNTDVVLFDSTALHSSLYDKQARWGKSFSLPHLIQGTILHAKMLFRVSSIRCCKLFANLLTVISFITRAKPISKPVNFLSKGDTASLSYTFAVVSSYAKITPLGVAARRSFLC